MLSNLLTINIYKKCIQAISLKIKPYNLNKIFSNKYALYNGEKNVNMHENHFLFYTIILILYFVWFKDNYYNLFYRSIE